MLRKEGLSLADMDWMAYAVKVELQLRPRDITRNEVDEIWSLARPSLTDPAIAAMLSECGLPSFTERKQPHTRLTPQERDKFWRWWMRLPKADVVARVIANVRCKDGIVREVFEEDGGREYVIGDDGLEIYGQWTRPADEPVIVPHKDAR